MSDLEKLAKKINEQMAGQPFKYEEYAKLIGGSKEYCQGLFNQLGIHGYVAVAMKYKDYVRWKIMLGEDRRKLMQKRIDGLEKEIKWKTNMLNDMRKML